MVGSYRKLWAIFLALLVVFLDQLTKSIAKKAFSIGESKIIIPKILSFTHIANTGASFGILRGMNTLLIVVGLVIVAGLIYYAYQHRQKKIEQLFFSLIIGGSVSNIIDRIAQGYVTDFIYFHFWPAFNLADSAITLGVIGIVVCYLKCDVLRKQS